MMTAVGMVRAGSGLTICPGNHGAARPSIEARKRSPRSIVQSAYCGVAAFKPSTQSTSTHGVTPLAPAFDTVGFFGATVADAVAVYEAVAPAFTASFDSPGGPPYNIVRLEDPTLETCDAQILRRVDDVATAIAERGHAVLAATSSEDLATIFETQLRVMHYEAARIYGGLLDLPEELVGPKFREMIGIGLELSEAAYRDDRIRLAAARVRFWATFSEAAPRRCLRASCGLWVVPYAGH
jgi:aspartyl-tRNA(Asn)/glutamyl-tRNA(Gln) amidotransferase subunit A